MFCYQCSEASKGVGCTTIGVCGKTPDVANLQDLLIWLTRGISYWALKAKEYGVKDDEVNLFVAEALFSTITNVNFSAKRMVEFIERAFELRERIKHRFLEAYAEKEGKTFDEKVPEAAEWHKKGGVDLYELKGMEVGVLFDKDEDIRSLKQLLIYGLKGIAAYTDHAYILKHTNDDILYFIQKGLVETLREDITVDELVSLVLEAGKVAVDAMALLDKANTTEFGNPEITEVYTGTYNTPAILVSGHDLLDLEELLKQTEGTGIMVYTHGEMLPAHAYPKLKKYKHLAGNFGSAWWKQSEEFEEFGGAILMTTNCLVPPKESYKDRVFTTGLVGFDKLTHIPNRTDGKPKDFSPVIKKALELGPIPERKGKKIVIGFAHDQVSRLLDKVIDAVKSGAIKKFVVMGGCDGRHKEREYYTEFAKKLPKDTVILTAGCAKYRYNHLDLGDIGGIPRVLDAGQCNDSYSLVVTALKLKEALGLDDINDLPIVYNIAWYEQKAIAVLLALLYLGVKGIRLGPVLPAFISPNVLKVLVDKFNIAPITTVEEDLKVLLS
ncbi:hydroxylamine reductase [Thermosipho melanesiensis]|uniref:Hydroxylamine reductase n=2 Tax=Thermosipho melanesiensis TaxID=46541 RepID=HCP_THEM4|nr:hydroxylamine reductase [Thermosipho melanesiensis]A6LL16.1 RecName: Full=Hydroxylamine reductase; AltName: Full=Hybrid-cluster protein; Short=HCP; AltName: Full=Prismane protein [Thermosipho melanesiensis BI429]ABR30617.1 hybrid cluster protein [Thermosipho melanesiensis BI429]APT73757.1 hydroxylamine reductase [Thermosipho melanesiensis]OOC35698.1 hydroxylamine reductase [Thermosipho melanesiensis]OOC38997.1 hydroxylamine reductase [Thermosipho melanesiensis]OOC39145.1 hydroxylamine redu